ncbi:hypothetical protein K402DRAFT_43116 [Aulographum hederae CBS 113979]|uniref:Uncharacterized protein n=1 Tax=Aulographum hederae CBS 113979 TaxID=1176131 RepID=A0A6G1H3L5_9PEZI|nr:hypothetical protein K402DRAFT_43116 [Aulographum hederae CBS 113979]
MYGAVRVTPWLVGWLRTATNYSFPGRPGDDLFDSPSAESKVKLLGQARGVGARRWSVRVSGSMNFTRQLFRLLRTLASVCTLQPTLGAPSTLIHHPVPTSTPQSALGLIAITITSPSPHPPTQRYAVPVPSLLLFALFVLSAAHFNLHSVSWSRPFPGPPCFPTIAIIPSRFRL